MTDWPHWDHQIWTITNVNLKTSSNQANIKLTVTYTITSYGVIKLLHQVWLLYVREVNALLSPGETWWMVKFRFLYSGLNELYLNACFLWKLISSGCISCVTCRHHEESTSPVQLADQGWFVMYVQYVSERSTKLNDGSSSSSHPACIKCTSLRRHSTLSQKRHFDSRIGCWY
jgi:hypothetical protein